MVFISGAQWGGTHVLLKGLSQFVNIYLKSNSGDKLTAVSGAGRAACIPQMSACLLLGKSTLLKVPCAELLSLNWKHELLKKKKNLPGSFCQG